MIAVVKGKTGSGTTIYTSFVQVAEHEGVPVLETALCVGGRSFESISYAIDHAREGHKALGEKIPDFGPMQSKIAVSRSRLPGPRTVYGSYIKRRSYKGVPVFEVVASPPWPESIDAAIASALEARDA